MQLRARSGMHVRLRMLSGLTNSERMQRKQVSHVVGSFASMAHRSKSMWKEPSLILDSNNALTLERAVFITLTASAARALQRSACTVCTISIHASAGSTERVSLPPKLWKIATSWSANAPTFVLLSTSARRRDCCSPFGRDACLTGSVLLMASASSFLFKTLRQSTRKREPSIESSSS